MDRIERLRNLQEDALKFPHLVGLTKKFSEAMRDAFTDILALVDAAKEALPELESLRATACNCDLLYGVHCSNHDTQVERKLRAALAPFLIEVD